jgi:hypothetical protein
MLVPSMTLPELRKEFEKDYSIVVRKSGYLARDIKHKFKPHGDQRIIKHYDYYSKYKNNWVIRVEGTKKLYSFAYMAYYYNEIGLAGVSRSFGDHSLMYFTSHFFKRYNERLNLNLTLPKDIIRAYLDGNDTFYSQILEELSPGLFKMFAQMSRGWALGTLDRNLKFLKMNTFITYEMLKGDQIEKNEALKGFLDKYKADAGNLR